MSHRRFASPTVTDRHREDREENGVTVVDFKNGSITKARAVNVLRGCAMRHFPNNVNCITEATLTDSVWEFRLVPPVVPTDVMQAEMRALVPEMSIVMLSNDEKRAYECCISVPDGARVTATKRSRVNGYNLLQSVLWGILCAGTVVFVILKERETEFHTFRH